MAETSRFFNGPSYSADTVNNNFYNVFEKLDGITVSANNDRNEMLHYATTAYQSSIASGTAWKSGVFYESTTKVLNHDTVTTGYKRIDRIVIRLTAGTSMALTVIKGTETTGTPVAPDITEATDIMVTKLLIDNTTGTPVYTITDERVYMVREKTKRLYVTTSIALYGEYSDIEAYMVSATPITLNITLGSVCHNTGTGTIQSLLPKCFVKNMGAGTATVRIKPGGTGTGYDITLLTNEWVLLHWDSTGWYIMADDFSTEKTFVYTTPGAISHVVPAGRRSCKVFVTGGGASGYRVAASAGDGGCAGGTAIAWLKQLTPGATITGTVGAGGAGRTTDGTGIAGTDSVFNTTIIGEGGTAAANGGGDASGGAINIIGGDRQYAAYKNSTAMDIGGHGGSSYWGGGGGIYAESGKAFGSGGAGNTGATDSGDGADGIIIIQYGDTK